MLFPDHATRNNDLILGSYAMGPFRKADWTAERQCEFDDQLLTLPRVRGFEIPFPENAQLHEFNPKGFSEFLVRFGAGPRESAAAHVVTCIFGTMQHLALNPNFGLASTSDEGRAAAMAFVREVFARITEVKRLLGPDAILAVQLQSAPRGGSPEALLASLREICSWAWGETRVTLEHCDAVGSTYPPQKGFLRIEEEILVLQMLRDTTAADCHAGLVINWGRSAVEGRSPETPLRHIEAAKSAALLDGLIFSGVAGSETAPGKNDAWQDLHCPPVSQAQSSRYPGALLTVEHMRAALIAAGSDSLRYLGLKVMTRPTSGAYGDMTALERVQVIRESMDLFAQASAVAGDN